MGSLALRQIGHDYLSLCGDVNSRIPAVRVRADGSMLLPLATDVDYDQLNEVTIQALLRYDIHQAYTLSLEDCASGEVFLGSLWPAPIMLDAADEDATAACLGREQEARCANVVLAFSPTAATSPPRWTWLLGGLGLLLLFARPRKSTPPLSSATTTMAAATQHAPVLDPQPLTPPRQRNGLAITPNCLVDPLASTLTVGDQTDELTHREGKLLTYFAERPNLVLQRADINDAVWGEEGIITGRSLDVFVSRLRKKLAVVDGVEIKTVHGVGYRLVVEGK